MSFSDVEFVLAQDTPLLDICDNLVWARTVTACYFLLSDSMNSTPTGELIQAVTKAHLYLDAHMDIITDFTFADSRYGLALRVAISCLVTHIPSDLHQREWNKWAVRAPEELCNNYPLNEPLLLPGEDGYKVNEDHCVHESDVRPSHVVKLPPPCRSTATPLPIKPVTETRVTVLSLPKPIPSPPVRAPPRPKPRMIHMPEPPKELSFSVPGRKLVGILLPPAGLALHRPHYWPFFAQGKSPVPQAVNVPCIAKKPVFDSSSDSDVLLSSDKEEGPAKVKEPLFFPSDNEIGSKVVHSPSPKSPPLPPSTGPSSKAQGKQRAVAPSSPLHQSSEAGPSNSTSDTICVADNTFYACAFHPALNLQFHEPPSREALECLKLSALPVAPKSLSKPPEQVRKGHEYINRAHLDANPYFIWPPLLAVFQLHSRRNHRQMDHHGPCSTHWTAGQLHSAATLLDPLILSGDGTIARGLAWVDTINTQLESLGKVVNSLRADREGVISKLADGLDSIALCEHGSEIINGYAAVSDFLKSFIIHPGSSTSGDTDSNNMGGSGDVVAI
ncbi:hypothetical protein IW261DRAFT_1573794 [Armillaria novae-zelandiae]|uniref:Uncharacterized protein n=1 Tax=Armillaria novae-zelandiae TaxID=153914 RepID=A0AA39NN08_9AGAR|nr:hypothetical protein IW261DRAFT_1573794 [Armillaria novae-zelandiae]